jgi:hypothetical protein
VTIPDDLIITVAALRQALELPAERPDGVRDLLAVSRPLGTPVPPEGTWLLALDGWPEVWRAEPGTGPRYLVMLRSRDDLHFVATVEETDPARWGEDGNASPQARSVPVLRTAFRACSVLAGCRLLAGSFGWPEPEEQYAFL